GAQVPKAHGLPAPCSCHPQDLMAEEHAGPGQARAPEGKTMTPPRICQGEGILSRSVDDCLEPKLGWIKSRLEASQEEVRLLILRFPLIFGYSTLKNLDPTVDFFFKELHGTIVEIRKAVLSCPAILSRSLDKRMLPRFRHIRNKNIEPSFERHKWVITTYTDQQFTKWLSGQGRAPWPTPQTPVAPVAAGAGVGAPPMLPGAPRAPVSPATTGTPEPPVSSAVNPSPVHLHTTLPGPLPPPPTPPPPLLNRHQPPGRMTVPGVAPAVAPGGSGAGAGVVVMASMSNPTDIEGVPLPPAHPQGLDGVTTSGSLMSSVGQPETAGSGGEVNAGLTGLAARHSGLTVGQEKLSMGQTESAPGQAGLAALGQKGTEDKGSGRDQFVVATGGRGSEGSATGEVESTPGKANSDEPETSGTELSLPRAKGPSIQGLGEPGARGENQAKAAPWPEGGQDGAGATTGTGSREQATGATKDRWGDTAEALS
ncbi:unnamed protein product, partial [Discosporangium mesarthrocarpum]